VTGSMPGYTKRSKQVVNQHKEVETSCKST
jgi:hypothetical protein